MFSQAAEEMSGSRRYGVSEEEAHVKRDLDQCIFGCFSFEHEGRSQSTKSCCTVHFQIDPVLLNKAQPYESCNHGSLVDQPRASTESKQSSEMEEGVVLTIRRLRGG